MKGKTILKSLLAIGALMALGACTPSSSSSNSVTSSQNQESSSPVSQEHVHSWETSWEKDATHHWHECEGENCSEISGKAEHTDGEATETEKAKCEVCGESYGSLKEHEHAFTVSKVDPKYLVSAADCDSKAVYYKSCACGEKGSETFESGEALGHKWSTDYSSDGTQHWHECTVEGCGATDTKENHSGGTATETSEAVCEKCGQAYGEKLPHTHVYDQEKVEAKYLVSEADCDSKAVYNKSCACGEKGSETFTYGDPLGHSYSTISYVWSNDNSSVTATRTCTNSGCSYKEEEIVETTYAVTTPSTTEVQGIGTYTATFVNTIFTTQTKTIDLDLIPTKTYYFDPGVWADNDATFGIKVWNSTSEKIFLPLTKGDSGLYEIECGVDMTNIMFVRYDSTSTVWWNDINNLTIPENKDMFVITSWESYLWDQYLTNDNASNFVAGETLYLQLNGDWGSAHTSFGLVCQFSGADGEGEIIPIEYVSGVIYKVTIPEGNYNCVRFAATSLDYSAIYNVTSYIYCDSDTTTNMLLLQSGWADMGGNWTIYTA